MRTRKRVTKKQLLSKIYYKNSLLIGLILISSLACIYTYFTNKTVSERNLQLIEGTLKEKPLLGEAGGDMPRKYIRIILNEGNERYYLKDCSYYTVLSKDKILTLKPNSEIKIGIRKSDSDKSKATICYLKIEDDVLLSLKAYNDCFTTYWKYLLPFIVVMIVVLMIRLINLIKNEHPANSSI